ncbi:hypothetical protein KIN20_020384 [Parelaphostrongylus tenuis]|uniref:Uncharacterized protein n=1 Tax=Parelaphostrongylus tenuis TaxID=148309 RepID=A0AAD5N6G7_PARTN|nr:hypothetical protein KIN20_020384 [Parelaphostrongylus tenuis]
MTRHKAGAFMISFLATISTAFGCGVMPAGQVSTRSFTVSGFTLPVAMAYVGKPEVRTRVPRIAANREGAQGIVSRLLMQTLSSQLLNFKFAFQFSEKLWKVSLNFETLHQTSSFARFCQIVFFN